MRTEREDPLITQKQWNAKLRELRIAKQTIDELRINMSELQSAAIDVLNSIACIPEGVEGYVPSRMDKDVGRLRKLVIGTPIDRVKKERALLEQRLKDRKQTRNNGPYYSEE